MSLFQFDTTKYDILCMSVEDFLFDEVQKRILRKSIQNVKLSRRLDTHIHFTIALLIPITSEMSAQRKILRRHYHIQRLKSCLKSKLNTLDTFKGQNKHTRTTSIGAALVSSQLIFTCSNSTIETLEKGVKYVQN